MASKPMDGFQLKKLMQAHPDAKLKDLVQQLLYEDIVNLRLAPGSKLNVNQLAATLGISRTPVVEAVGGLSDIGFVVSHPGVPGSFVLDLSHLGVLSALLEETGQEEGFRRKNLMATHLIGPILTMNPLFTKYLLRCMGAPEALAFEDTAMEAYRRRLAEFHSDSFDPVYH